MTYVPYKKGTVLIPSGGTKHLFAIVTDACAAGEHLLVNVTSIRPNIKHDATCELAVGDHPFIKQPSYVDYRRAEVMTAARITARVADNTFTPKDDLSEALLQAFRDGLEDSDDVAQWVTKYYVRAKKEGR